MHEMPGFTKRTWMARLAAVPAVHRAIRISRAQRIAQRVLALHPVERQLPRLGGMYRVRYLESFLIADEIFRREVYREAFEDGDVRTIIDVGSNVGYFTCYAAEITGRRDLVGLAVDANEDMTDETRWHIERNALAGMRAIHGLVGYPASVREATFYVNASNIASSAQPMLNPGVPPKGESRRITVPAVDLARVWHEHAGGRPIDLLKIDVEGFERELLQNCEALLSLARSVVLEWHKWVVTKAEVDELLLARGFAEPRTISENRHCGVAMYRRRAPPSVAR